MRVELRTGKRITMKRHSRLNTAEAMLWLLAAYGALKLLPFRKIADFLGRRGGQPVVAISADASAIALYVRTLVRRACRLLGHRPSCLVRSVAAMILLRRNGLEGTLYLGVRQTDGQLRAHAWVRCGDIFVIGGHGRRNFTVLHSFTRAR
jgi:hypothetical protein